jgi:hypothetical protein
MLWRLSVDGTSRVGEAWRRAGFAAREPYESVSLAQMGPLHNLPTTTPVQPRHGLATLDADVTHNDEPDASHASKQSHQAHS